MSINKFNSEGYYDPTPYEALMKIEKETKQQVFRPLVYICSPFSGEIEKNIESARRYSKFAVECGYIPLAPHLLLPQFMDDSNPKERALAVFMDMALMSKCAEVWVFGKIISNGMAIEIAKAKQKGQKIRYFNHKCKEVRQS